MPEGAHSSADAAITAQRQHMIVAIVEFAVILAIRER
jgi:hypothetical protein